MEVDTKQIDRLIDIDLKGAMISSKIAMNQMIKQEFELPERTKKVYNILGDYPDVIAKFLVERMITNKKNDVKINWLTNAKASFRFMTSAFIKE